MIQLSYVRNSLKTLVRSRHASHYRLLHGSSNPSPLALQIWGANTGVGKTVFSAALLRATEKSSLYIKPVQSGYPKDDDSSVIAHHVKHADAVSFYAYHEPVSPDLAAKLEEVEPASNDSILLKTRATLDHFFITNKLQQELGRVAVLIETAGGVLSPAPSGSLQADLYRPLRLPSLLLGDNRVGGITTTLSSYEALRLRGYSVPAVILFADRENFLQNEFSIEKHVDNKETSVFVAPSLPPDDVPLEEYLSKGEVSEFFTKLYGHLEEVEMERKKGLETMQKKSKDVFWYPFTQHRQLGKVTCIDSAYGDEYKCYDEEKGMHDMIDAIGSWWTTGVGHGNADVAKAIAHAGGRYGHVMFAEATYEPAFVLAKKLLQGPGKEWASRVFYSDDGSTAVEVALKMAFRKRASEYPEFKGKKVLTVGLKDSYHGDTLGAMDCCESSDYNSKQTPWYESKGIFFDPPIASIQNGQWVVSMPQWMEANYDIVIKDTDELYDKNRAHRMYNTQIAQKLEEVLDSGKVDLAALIMEPLFLAAGGMKLVDPAFQRSLVDECRKRGIPIVFDEVFTGLWRLGVESAASLLDRKPDIATFGKLLTGGTIPLAVTLASEEVHNAFDGNSKLEALLHGHSYTAHAMGCAAGVESLRQYESLPVQAGKVLEYWDMGSAAEISSLETVKSVTVLGTVLSIEMKSDGHDGYAATGAKKIAEQLIEKGVFARPLGNVIYLMCNPVSKIEVRKQLMRTLTNILDPPKAYRKEKQEEHTHSISL